MSDTLDYHLGELAIAQDRSHQNYSLPEIKPSYKTILDVGCGMGQTLIAQELAPEVQGYGVDIDADAIDAGRKLVGPNIQLSVGSAEKLDFPDNSFDLVFCRVALPYTQVQTALNEMARVAKPGGDLWLSMHPFSMYRRRTLKSLKSGRLKDVLFCGFVIVNGLLVGALGKQLSFGGRTESFQTAGGIRRALARAGLTCTAIERGVSFVVRARKPAGGQR